MGAKGQLLHFDSIPATFQWNNTKASILHGANNILSAVPQTHGLDNNLEEKRASSVKDCTNHGLIFISGIGAQVKNTVSSRKDFRPHTSDRAPMSGALRNDSKP